MQEHASDPVCPDCAFLDQQQLGSPAEIAFLQHCRAIRHYVDGSAAPYSLHVAALLLTSNGRILDIDRRSVDYLKSTGLLDIRHNRLVAINSDFNLVLQRALARVALVGEPDTLNCSAATMSHNRYTILLQPAVNITATLPVSPCSVACFIYPLGRRRMASSRQLISMFELSAAEARLARALCHGESLEQYAEAQGVKLSTVKTQLRAIFAKTQTDRQAALVNLITGIPPLR